MSEGAGVLLLLLVVGVMVLVGVVVEQWLEAAFANRTLGPA